MVIVEDSGVQEYPQNTGAKAAVDHESNASMPTMNAVTATAVPIQKYPIRASSSMVPSESCTATTSVTVVCLSAIVEAGVTEKVFRRSCTGKPGKQDSIHHHHHPECLLYIIYQNAYNNSSFVTHIGGDGGV